MKSRGKDTGAHAAAPIVAKPSARPADLRAGFFAFLGEIRPEIERRLRARFDRKVLDLTPHGAEVRAMAEAARDLTLRGGKRFRAALLAAGYIGAAPDAPLDPALEGGVALELFQTYLLVQDDWMDSDDLRRGGPSVHAALARAYGSARLGDAAAILTSDLVWGMALETLASIDVPADRVGDVVRRFCRVHEDVVVGQALDLFARAEDVEAMHALKTGSYTVRGPLCLGAAIAGASSDAIASLEAYAAPLGVAFQLRDDLLGTFATTEETGKPEGGDLRAGKRTAVIAEAERRLDAAGKRALEKALGKDHARPDAIRAAIAALESCGARDAVTARLAELCSRASDLAASVPLSDRARDLLRGAAESLRVEGA